MSDIFIIFLTAQQPLMTQGFLIFEASQSHNTLRHTTLGGTPLDRRSTRCRDLYLTTNNSHKRPKSVARRDSNLQSQEVSSLRPTPLTARPLGLAILDNIVDK